MTSRLAAYVRRVRYLDIHEGEPLDEAQFVGWIQQAAALPGWVP